MKPFLALPNEAVRYSTAATVIFPCPLEKTTSYGKGTARGPKAIIEASAQVEFYDCELEQESWPPGIHTLPPLDFSASDAPAALRAIEQKVGALLDDRKFPICLGGEHTLSAGAIAACAKRFPNLSVLQIDAHADLRADYEGTPYSHACAMRLIVPQVKKIVGVGIRSLDASEADFARTQPNITLILDHRRDREGRWIEAALAALTDTVYLTIDVDGFDPGLFGATGTPEPGGLTWQEGLDLLRRCFAAKRVVGADCVELMPLPHAHAAAFAAAKLVYKLIGYRKRFQAA